MINVMILEEAIKKAKKEIVNQLEQTSMSIVSELRDKLSKLDREKLSTGYFNQTMNSLYEPFLSKLDASISSRLSKADFDSWKAPWTAERAGKIDNLDASVSSRLSKVDFSKDIDTLKKSLGQRIIELSSRLALMDAKPNAETLPAVKAALDSVPVIGLVTKVLTTQGERYTIPRGYHNGSGYVDTDITNLRPENVRWGVNVGGVVGNHAGPMRTSGSVIETVVKVPYPENYTTHRIESKVYTAPEPIQAIYLKWDTWVKSYYGVSVFPRLSLLIATNLFDKYTIVERNTFWNKESKIYPIERYDDNCSVYIYMINEKSFKIITTCKSEIKVSEVEKKYGEMNCGTSGDTSDGLRPSLMYASIYY